ncbi:glycerophosphoryl diester phosphodiesterase membrane domain-containing protein [Acetonema longum]|uniref:Glycerophosphoryl diester phosphodiesterase membrane domain-containing protein n=1 Tax=Acetonema longum DSM 6540 TaxID=1009370 RepID=F7NP89_9FIRM|nr:glycerophosphoryl diester phosphodiesterase membrane domain-containing protein [Acetonema longum]EGO62212.1 hypothetical protein ALO_19662 [Acetonema longum DSM 6540]
MNQYQETIREYDRNEIWQISWSVFTSQFKSILIIMMLFYIPMNGLLMILESFLHCFTDLEIYYRASVIVEFLFWALASMGIAVVVEDTLLGNDVSWLNAMGRAFSHWKICLQTNVLQGLIILGFLLLFVFPGVIWAVNYAFAIQVVVLREMSGKSALEYSASLVRGRWEKIFGFLLLFGGGIVIITQGISYVLSRIPMVFARVPDLAMFSGIVTDVATTFFSVVCTVLFLHLEYLYDKRQEEKHQENSAVEPKQSQPAASMAVEMH